MTGRPEIQRQVAARLVAGDLSTPLDLTLQYFMSDPYAVRLLFQEEDGQTKWIVSRSLLQDGTSSQSGDGDFRIGPSPRRGWLLATFAGTFGTATAELDRQGLLAFLDATTRLVDYGHEVQDVDAILARIFAGESA